MHWRECFRGIQQQDAIEVRCYRSRDLQKAVLERELSGDTAAGGNRSRRLLRSRDLQKAAKGCAGVNAFGGYSSRRL